LKKQRTRTHSAGDTHRDKRKLHGRELYERWEVWVVIILMLAAMVFYFVSRDASVLSGASKAGKSPPPTTAPSRP